MTEKPLAFKIGDHVEKVGGDYTFDGIIVAAFKKLSGLERFVAEDSRGILHVYSEKTLRLAESKFSVEFYNLYGEIAGKLNLTAIDGYHARLAIDKLISEKDPDIPKDFLTFVCIKERP